MEHKIEELINNEPDSEMKACIVLKAFNLSLLLTNKAKQLFSTKELCFDDFDVEVAKNPEAIWAIIHKLAYVEPHWTADKVVDTLQKVEGLKEMTKERRLNGNTTVDDANMFITKYKTTWDEIGIKNQELIATTTLIRIMINAIRHERFRKYFILQLQAKGSKVFNFRSGRSESTNVNFNVNNWYHVVQVLQETAMEVDSVAKVNSEYDNQIPLTTGDTWMVGVGLSKTYFDMNYFPMIRPTKVEQPKKK